MRHLTLVLTLLLTNVCYSQIDIPGLYVNPICDTIWFDLRPDNTYSNFECELCIGPCTLEIGRYSIIGDTIFLTPSDSSTKPTKLFYIRNSPTENDPLSPWHHGNIAPVFPSETILSKNTRIRLSDYECTQWGYIKMQGYYSSNKLLFKTEAEGKIKTTRNYYESGMLKSIEHYYFDKHYGDRKTGAWYFYTENGQIEKIETYKRGKLKRILNTL